MELSELKKIINEIESPETTQIKIQFMTFSAKDVDKVSVEYFYTTLGKIAGINIILKSNGG